MAPSVGNLELRRRVFPRSEFVKFMFMVLDIDLMFSFIFAQDFLSFNDCKHVAQNGR